MKQEHELLVAACRAFLKAYERASEIEYFGQMLDSAFADVLEPMYELTSPLEEKEDEVHI